MLADVRFPPAVHEPHWNRHTVSRNDTNAPIMSRRLELVK